MNSWLFGNSGLTPKSNPVPTPYKVVPQGNTPTARVSVAKPVATTPKKSRSAGKAPNPVAALPASPAVTGLTLDMPGAGWAAPMALPMAAMGGDVGMANAVVSTFPNIQFGMPELAPPVAAVDPAPDMAQTFGYAPPVAPAPNAWEAFTGALGGLAGKLTPDWLASPVEALRGSGAFDAIDPATKSVTRGWLSPVFQGAQALGGLYLGKKNYDLAKDQADFQKAAYAANYANQMKTLNMDMEDRQRVRAASSKRAEDVDSYMKRNRVM